MEDAVINDVTIGVYVLIFWCLGSLVTAIIADSKGRRFIVWLLLGILLGIFGIILVALLPSVRREAPPSADPKWQALKEVDPEIASVAQRVAALGPHFEAELAKKFLVLGDKSYLAAIEQQLTEQAETERKRLEAQSPQDPWLAKPSEASLRTLREYQAAMRAYGMRDPHTNRRVVQIEPYEGNIALGGIKVFLDGGSVVFRNHDTIKAFNADPEPT